MTQIVVTLENNADENLLRRMIENMKGVLNATLVFPKGEDTDQPKENSQWLSTIHSIKDSINPSVIDLNDPRTNYIMSK